MKMTFLNRVGRLLRVHPLRLNPADAYDRWAETYDSQLDNVVFALESPLFSELLARVEIEGKAVLDIGCGTGRHWAEILSRKPAKLYGVDPSSRMLEKLKLRYSEAQTKCARGDHLPEIAGASFDVIISTLALAHIPDAAAGIDEWSRILRKSGAILITDFHPGAIRAGMKRTFSSRGQTIEIEHYPTGLPELREIANDCGLRAVFTGERTIDNSVRPFFERAGFSSGYEEHKNQPLVFAMHFMKP